MSKKTMVITQGEHCVSDSPQATISTLLGSCVACCLWDPIAHVGGMNHILLAQSAKTTAQAANFAGVNAMELLINDIHKLGGLRSRLKAKVFGGARMISGLSDIGTTNGLFTLGFLEAEGIECVSQSLGGDCARHLVFTPATGAAKIKAQRSAIVEEVAKPVEKPSNDLELF